MDYPDDTDDALLRELHHDLQARYQRHGPAVERAWRSFDHEVKIKLILMGNTEARVPKHSSDGSQSINCYIFPEWNLEDLSRPGWLLDIFKHRTTLSLTQQYQSPFRGGAPDNESDLLYNVISDRAFIEKQMKTEKMRLPRPYKDCYTMFTDDTGYGGSCKVLHPDDMTEIKPTILAGFCVHQSKGELILQRQMSILQNLSMIFDSILEHGAMAKARQAMRDKQMERVLASVKPGGVCIFIGGPSEQGPEAGTWQLPTQQDDTGTSLASTMTGLHIQLPPQPQPQPQQRPERPNPTFSDLMDTARYQQMTLEDDLSFLLKEPTEFADAVYAKFYNRPELVPDKKGRALPVYTDKYISGAVFDTVHSAVQATAVWTYIRRLLELLNSTTDKFYRTIILQEISNICHLEYTRNQSGFKREMQMKSNFQYFKRMSNSFDRTGNPKVNIKINLTKLSQSDPQMHHFLRLCQGETTASKAMEWIEKLRAMEAAGSFKAGTINRYAAAILSNLADMVDFIKDLYSATSMPAPSRKKAQLFVSKSQALEAELNDLRDEVDLRDFAVPIVHLLEPGMSEGALATLERFVIDKTGSKLGFLYQDMIDDCLADLASQHEYELKKPKPVNSQTTLPHASVQEGQKQIIELRKLKEKTRPSHSSIFDLTSSDATKTKTAGPVPSSQTFKVRPATLQVFHTLFSQSEARGSVAWVSFEAAMTDLGFSVFPKMGSMFTFYPPKSLAVKRPITIHRPHQSHIEGDLIFIYARRLQRVYGWGERTFVARK